jgi:hypothetical protein
MSIKGDLLLSLSAPSPEPASPSREQGTLRDWRAALASAACLACTLVFFGPSQIYFGNAFDFPFGFAAILPILSALALSLSAIVFLISLSFRKWHERAVALAFCLGFLLWVQGNLMPWGYGPLDGRPISWPQFRTQGWLEAVAWLLVLLLVFFRPRPAFRLARRGSLFLLCVQLVSLVVTGLSAPEIEGKSKLVFDVSDRNIFSRSRNVIILVVDTFQSDAFEEILDREPRLKENFKDFTYFRNCLGGYTGTFFSVPLILTGQYWDGAQSIAEYTKTAYLSGSLPFALKNAGYRVGLYPLQFPDIYYSKRVASNLVARKVVHAADVAFLLDLALFRQLPQFLKKKVYNDQDWLLSRVFAGPSYLPGGKRNPQPRRKNYMDLNKDREDVEALEAGMTLIGRPVFKYLHWRGLHRPLARNEDCEYEPLFYNRPNYLRQSRCILRLLGRFLKKLKEEGIYDDSLVVIVGDHGVRMENIGIRYETSPGCWQLDDRGDQATIIRQASIPVLLVKKIAAAQPEMKVSDAPAVLSDIPRTVFTEIGVNSTVPGISLFALAENQGRLRPFYKVVGNIQRGPELKKIVVDGFARNPASWREQSPGNDSFPDGD